MSRFIDTEPWEQELADTAKTLYTEGDFESGDYAYYLRRKLQERPAADVVPVIHAYWEDYTDSSQERIYGHSYYGFRCSHCGTDPGKEYGLKIKTPYCPKCGAETKGAK